MVIDVNTQAVAAFTKKLKELHKSAFPVAVRGTLNDAVFDVKTKTMPASSSNKFVNRSKNFFKANSKFVGATGFSLSAMKAEVGFFSNNLKGGNNYAIRDLAQQENSGRIGGKSFIPTIFARQGNKATGLIRPNARLEKIKNIRDANKVTHLTKKQRFMVAAKKAGRGGFVLSEGMLWRIDENPAILDKKVTGITYKGRQRAYRHFSGALKRTPLYSYSHGRHVTVSQTNFMKVASNTTAREMERFYQNQALRQLQKIKLK